MLFNFHYLWSFEQEMAARSSTLSRKGLLNEAFLLIIMEACPTNILTHGLLNWLLATDVYLQLQLVYSGWLKRVSVVLQIHRQHVMQSRNHLWSSQTLWLTSPVLPGNSRRSLAPLELNRVLSDTARAFSGEPDIICSSGGAFKLLQYLTYRIAKFGSS